MSYIIGKNCVDIKDGACVEVCPVDCIYEGDTQMYIQPNDCINCGACIIECPVQAIFDSEEEAIKAGDMESVEKNYSYFNLKF